MKPSPYSCHAAGVGWCLLHSSAERRLAPMNGVPRLPVPNRGRHAGPLHAPPPARAQRGGGVPSRRHLASAVHVPYKLTRFCTRDPVALVWSCQRSSLWLLSRHQREPLRRCWIDHPYGEEEITRLEDELLPAMESFLERIDVIDQQLREAQDRQVAQFELSGCRGCPPHHPPGRRASRDQRSAS